VLALAKTIVPAVAALDANDQRELLRVIDDALSIRDPALRMQFLIFLDLLRWAPAARYGRPFDRLTPDRQNRVLHVCEDSGIARLRVGLWGIKTLIFMGYYGNPARWPSIHYAPRDKGNEQLRG